MKIPFSTVLIVLRLHSDQLGERRLGEAALGPQVVQPVAEPFSHI